MNEKEAQQTESDKRNKQSKEHIETELSSTTENLNKTKSEDLINNSTDSINLKCSSHNLDLNYDIHFTLMLLLLCIFLLNVPSLLTWLKNPRFPERIYLDSFSVPFIVIALSLAILWEVNFFKSRRFKILYYVIRTCSISVIMFGSVHLFRISEIVSFVFAVLAVSQAFAVS